MSNLFWGFCLDAGGENIYIHYLFLVCAAFCLVLTVALIVSLVKHD